MVRIELIEELKYELKRKSSIYNQELNQLLKDETVDLDELKLFYLFQIKELEYLIDNTIDKNKLYELNYDYETYQYRLLNLNKNICNQNTFVETIEKLLEIKSEFEKRNNDNFLIVNQEEYENEFNDSQIETLMWCWYFNDKREKK